MILREILLPLEVAQMLDSGPSQLAANRLFRDIVQAKGYDVSYHEYRGGHDTSSLELPLAKALSEIFQSEPAYSR
jgi:hypothetical protein